jgi:DNA-binding CsgD family transcriptional regulator
MVRHGKTSKEMAEIMNLSVSGVDFHRRRLGNKLGLTNSPRNLRTHLLSLTGTKQLPTEFTGSVSLFLI